MKTILSSTSGKLGLLCFTIATLSLSPIANAADDDGWYLGASIGRTSEDISFRDAYTSLLPAGAAINSYSDGNQDQGGKIFAGYQFNRYFAIEGGYFDLGEFNYSAITTPAGPLSSEFGAKGLNLDLVGILPMTEKLSLLARYGYNNARTTSAYQGGGVVPAIIPRVREENEHTKFGLGAEYDLSSSFSLRLEAERYRLEQPFSSVGNVDLYSVGLVYRFGQKTAARPASTPAPTPAPKPVVAKAAAPVVAPVAAAPTPPAPVRVVFSADSLFDFDKSDVKTPGKAHLDEFVMDLRGVTYDTIRVTGHSDRIGNDDYNMALSVRRAEAVKAYLVQTGRLPAAKITARGVDGSNPVTRPSDCPRTMTKAALIVCLQPDRRVVVEVTGTK